MKKGSINFLVVKNNKRNIQVSFDKISKLSVLNSKQIKEYLLNIVEKPNTNLTINLSGISFIDSTAFDTLNLVSRVASQYHSTLQLLNVEPEAMELIDLVKKHGVFAIKKIVPVHSNVA